LLLCFLKALQKGDEGLRLSHFKVARRNSEESQVRIGVFAQHFPEIEKSLRVSLSAQPVVSFQKTGAGRPGRIGMALSPPDRLLDHPVKPGSIAQPRIRLRGEIKIIGGMLIGRGGRAEKG